MSHSLTGIVLSFLLLRLIGVQNPTPRPTGDSTAPVSAHPRTVIKVFLHYEPVAHARVALLANGTNSEISGETDDNGTFDCYPTHNDFILSVESGDSKIRIPIELGAEGEEVRVELQDSKTRPNLGIPKNISQNLVIFRAVFNEQPVVDAKITVESGAGVSWLCSTSNTGTCSLELPHMDLDLYASSGRRKIHRPLRLRLTRGEVLLEFDRAQVELPPAKSPAHSRARPPAL